MQFIQQKKRKPTTIKNPQANSTCERIHQILRTMMCISEIDIAESVEPADIDTIIEKCSMGYLPNVPHGTKSLTRRSNIWIRHAL
jgi:hypothetical protein